MKYLVLETHPGYAVLLDEEGRFVRAANFRYRIGEQVENAVLMREPEKKRRWLPAAGGAAAACIALGFAGYFGYYAPNFTVYGSLTMEINPSVEMALSETGRVLGLTGLNPDGEALVEGYDYRGRRRDEAAEELVSRAIDMGFLSGGEAVTISVRSRDGGWQADTEAGTRAALEGSYGEWIVIRLPDDPPPEEPEKASGASEPEIVIPLPEPESEPESEPGPAAEPPAESAPVYLPADDDDDGPFEDDGDDDLGGWPEDDEDDDRFEDDEDGDLDGWPEDDGDDDRFEDDEDGDLDGWPEDDEDDDRFEDDDDLDDD